jgi:adenine/guanine phosphoribosyltransferase-like PRPP-binding protein
MAKIKKIVQNIFSIKNIEQHKVICLFGLKLKIKRKNKAKVRKLSFRTVQNLTDLIRDRISILPEDIDLVVGIPRSGVIPAFLIALFLNKKACTINEII